jgi:hypothetical protein
MQALAGSVDGSGAGHRICCRDKLRDARPDLARRALGICSWHRHNSLVTGKNTGNFRNSDARIRTPVLQITDSVEEARPYM